jgi:monofunctional biosynthetic peptidoglycan transglycosylase
MRRRAAQIAVGPLAAGFALLSYLYLTLPDVRPLATRNPQTSAFIELRRSEAIAAGKTPRRVQRWVRYEAISNNLRRAVLVAEDDAFWQHDGVDVVQLRQSLEANFEKGKLARGGSTITQQLAKNLYLSPSKSPIRKLRELLIARRLEAALSKRRIFEIYLNVIEWGDGIYGAEAAARSYFRKSAGVLSPEEAALLAGAIINPRLHNPARPTARLRVRQQIILKRMGWAEPPPEAPEIPEPPPPPAVLPEHKVPILPQQGSPPAEEPRQPQQQIPPVEPATPPVQPPDAHPLSLEDKNRQLSPENASPSRQEPLVDAGAELVTDQRRAGCKPSIVTQL